MKNWYLKIDIEKVYLTPCWSVLEFWKIKLEKSSLTNWIFSLQKSSSKLIFAGYTGSKKTVWSRLKNTVCQTWFFQLDFSKNVNLLESYFSVKWSNLAFFACSVNLYIFLGCKPENLAVLSRRLSGLNLEKCTGWLNLEKIPG